MSLQLTAQHSTHFTEQHAPRGRSRSRGVPPGPAAPPLPPFGWRGRGSARSAGSQRPPAGPAAPGPPWLQGVLWGKRRGGRSVERRRAVAVSGGGGQGLPAAPLLVTACPLDHGAAPNVDRCLPRAPRLRASVATGGEGGRAALGGLSMSSSDQTDRRSPHSRRKTSRSNVHLLGWAWLGGWGRCQPFCSCTPDPLSKPVPRASLQAHSRPITARVRRSSDRWALPRNSDTDCATRSAAAGRMAAAARMTAKHGPRRPPGGPAGCPDAPACTAVINSAAGPARCSSSEQRRRRPTRRRRRPAEVHLL